MLTPSNDIWRGKNVSCHQVSQQAKNNLNVNKETNAGNNFLRPDQKQHQKKNRSFKWIWARHVAQ